MPSLIDILAINGILLATDESILNNIRMQPKQSDSKFYDEERNEIVSELSQPRYNPNAKAVCGCGESFTI